MAERRRVSTNNATTTKQVVYSYMAAQAVGQVTKGEGDRVGATAKYCAKAIDDDEGDVEADEDEEEEENGGARRSRCVASGQRDALHASSRCRHRPQFVAIASQPRGPYKLTDLVPLKAS
jgi:hypothetical protein